MGLLRLAALALAALWGACATPSVPIPPPEPEKMVFSLDTETGSAQFSYDPDPSYAGAVVYVFNRDAGEGVITTAAIDGSVAPTEPFVAAESDRVLISFEVEDQLATTCVVLRDGRSSSGLECDP